MAVTLNSFKKSGCKSLFLLILTSRTHGTRSKQSLLNFYTGVVQLELFHYILLLNGNFIFNPTVKFIGDVKSFLAKI